MMYFYKESFKNKMTKLATLRKVGFISKIRDDKKGGVQSAI